MNLQDIIIKDNFYPDPYSIRKLALEQNYYYYEPHWYSTSLKVRYGKIIENPTLGFKYNNEQVIDLIESVIGTKVDMNTWYDGGDDWNGAFHAKYKNDDHVDFIHHHFKKGDCENGYSGVVYLHENPSMKSGTKIWMNKKTNSIKGEFGPFFEKQNENWEVYKHVDNKFNRLVLFKGDIFHSGDMGYGNKIENCRLFQTFFFNVIND